MIKHPLYDNLLQFETLNQYESLIAFTTTINGGTSCGSYGSFNLGLHSGDDLGCVSQDRMRLASILNIAVDDLYFPYQIHADKICIIDSNFLQKTEEERLGLMHGVDAIITNQKGICIGVTTADCVPIIIYDPIKKVLAAVHAGWRSTVAKLPEKTVQTMVAQFGCDPKVLVAAIGPSISRECFEVGDEVVEVFDEAGFSRDEISLKNIKTNKYHIDLWTANQLLLNNLGVSNNQIEIAGLCTYFNSNLFFSARRQTIYSGRMISGGVLR